MNTHVRNVLKASVLGAALAVLPVSAGAQQVVPTNSVPEPGTLALIAFGMLTFAWVFRRKRVIA